MATILLSAAGAAVGGSVGGTLAGLSSVAVGRAVGATLGRVIDQRILGQGGQPVETGKVDRFRMTGAGEGDAIAQVYGRMRIGGNVIWASDFQETTTVSGGGKGGSRAPRTTAYSYTVSLAIALCEGVITRVGRVWADGEEVAPDDLNMRVYLGTADQLPDPTIEAVEGQGHAPAYRGTAYVVMENLSLERFGNRVPQFSFEVVRPEQEDSAKDGMPLAHSIRGTALIPGTGEYALATTPVTYSNGPGSGWRANISTPANKTDFAVSLDAMCEELPRLEAASLVVSWFGNDLRCGSCQVQPKVEDASIEGREMPWQVASINRSQAGVIARQNDRPIYGGTPADAAVIEAIQAMNDAGKAVMFYPFILMDQVQNNTLPDPYTGQPGQPRLPWRGRITLSAAPGRPGSPDGTADADTEVAAFIGTVQASDFAVSGGSVVYTGPNEWSLSRFILHYAALCAAAGGVDSFCISSEMRGLTQIRGAGGMFVAVQALRDLAAEARTLLGPDTKIGYAADWSEYFGYQPNDGSGDRYFHLDPLWADDNIDFVGIDNYMPLADWRDGHDHLDAEQWPSVYDTDYLKANIEGGEGFDWYYHSVEAREAQIRTPITDGQHNEPWVYRYKDIRGWWTNVHHERIGGVRSETPTAWVPQSKPIWFTEYGCAAIDKGANQPNKFLDAKSSESNLPRYSSGARDELMQMQYLRAVNAFYADEANNPVSEEYGGPMVDMTRAFVWAWDTRPYPFFPNKRELWSDGENYGRGHWINGRMSSWSLSALVDDVCAGVGVNDFDTSYLHGYVRGYAVQQVSDARASLQPLMIRHGFDAIERDGVLAFRQRDGIVTAKIDPALLAVSDELSGTIEQVREPTASLSGRMRLRFVQADGDFDAIAEEAVLADEATHSVAASEVNMALTRVEGRQTVERWLTEARVSREGIRLALPISQASLGAGDVIAVPNGLGDADALYRIDRAEQSGVQIIDAVRIEPEVYQPALLDDEIVAMRPFVAPVPVTPLLMDLPLLRGDEVSHAPYVAATAKPWPGTVALYQSTTDANYSLNSLIPRRAIVGHTQNAMPAARAGIVDNGEALDVKLVSGSLESVTQQALLSGANLAAIGDGSSDKWEVFQFAQADLIAPNTYRLSQRLRGQAGSDGIMPGIWPAGSVFVLLNGAVQQIEMGRNLRGVLQHYRIGPAQRGYDDPSYQHLTEAFGGNGLRPYSPAHLKCDRADDGACHLSWIRRTRLDGDSWDAAEVPLGEESETYLLRVIKNGETLRETTTNTNAWSYSAIDQTADGVAGSFAITVAQLSSVYGAGPEARIAIAT